MTSALIEIRLSNETEESASPERQREQDTRYCQMRCRDIARHRPGLLPTEHRLGSEGLPSDADAV